MAQGSWLMPQASWLMANKKIAPTKPKENDTFAAKSLFDCPPKRCAALAAPSPPEALQIICFTRFQLLGSHKGLQKPSFAKVPQTLAKPHFWNQIAVLPKRHKCAALAAASPPEALQIMCFTTLQLLGPHREPTRACRPTSRVFPDHVFYEVPIPWASQGGLRKPSFAKVPQTLATHFGAC